MNEVAMILDRLGIPTRDVLEAAGTKWNFLRFTPGLVGGHCIGVDPYYLTAKAESVGYLPQVILAGRRINDGMGAYIAQRLAKMLSAAGRSMKAARVGVLGLTFKENVPDIRNSRVPDIIRELREYGIEAVVHDPLADAPQALQEYGLEIAGLENFNGLDGLIIAVPHDAYLAWLHGRLSTMLSDNGVIIDVKSVLDPKRVPEGVTYWSL